VPSGGGEGGEWGNWEERRGPRGERRPTRIFSIVRIQINYVLGENFTSPASAQTSDAYIH
jgi:hypothetical protein